MRVQNGVGLLRCEASNVHQIGQSWPVSVILVKLAVSPGCVPRPSLSGAVEDPRHADRVRVAGVRAPAFV